MYQQQRRQQDERAIWDKMAGSYDQNVMRTFKEAYRQTIDTILEDLMPGSRVLEIGCGTGIIAAGVASHAGEVIGVDLSPEMIRQAQKKTGEGDLPNLCFEVGDAYDLPFETASFDLVLLTNLLHVVKEPDTVLSEAKRLLKPDGILMTVTDCYAEPVPLGTRLKLAAQRLLKLLGFVKYMRYYRKAELIDLISRNGFHIQREAILHPAPVNYFLSGKRP
jgi:ubiquinone/menaquinone biosynthesis C-methylase UbiE